jgi:hypothetical protein
MCRHDNCLAGKIPFASIITIRVACSQERHTVIEMEHLGGRNLIYECHESCSFLSQFPLSVLTSSA